VVLLAIDLDGFRHVQQTSIRARCIPQSSEQVPPFHAHDHDAFYTLSICGFSNDHHSSAGHFTCALILTFNPHIHVSQSLYPRPPPPRNLLEGDFTVIFLYLSLLKDSNMSDATRGSPTVLL
jgi:hypothetical protein